MQSRRFRDPLGNAHPDFKLSRAGWELYHMPRYPRANYPLAEPQRITKEQFAAEAAQPAIQQGEKAMRGLKRLANVTEQLMKQVDAEAEAVANEIAAAHADTKAAIGEFKAHAGEIRKVAAEVRAQLGQISNVPTEGSGS